MYKKYPITNQRDLRNSFWKEYPQFTRNSNYTQNDYPADIHMTWCDYIENAVQIGLISEALGNNTTL